MDVLSARPCILPCVASPSDITLALIILALVRLPPSGIPPFLPHAHRHPLPGWLTRCARFADSPRIRVHHHSRRPRAATLARLAYIRPSISLDLTPPVEKRSLPRPHTILLDAFLHRDYVDDKRPTIYSPLIPIIPLDAALRQAYAAVSRLDLSGATVRRTCWSSKGIDSSPRNQAVPGSPTPTSHRPRILRSPCLLTFAPPAASRENDSGPSRVRTPASTVWMDRRGSEEPSHTRLPSPDSPSPSHPFPRPSFPPPPPMSLSPRTTCEDAETGSSCVQDGCSLLPTPRHPSILVSVLALLAGDEDADDGHSSPHHHYRGDHDAKTRMCGRQGRLDDSHAAVFVLLSVRPSRRLFLGVDSSLTPTRHPTPTGITLNTHLRPSVSSPSSFFLGIITRTTPTRRPKPSGTTLLHSTFIVSHHSARALSPRRWSVVHR
ncbi:hypothetical protein DFH09DRAFT_1306602 [Mycena vulgaris]|nr:hypothetical protein DFH09DRAFT_1306602 [Mycena vulgaris]